MSRSKDILFLSLEDVLACDVKDMNLACQDVLQGFQKLAFGGLTTPYKTSLCPCGTEHHDGLINVLSCSVELDAENIFGFKILGSSPSKRAQGLPRATGLLLLYEASTKEPICIMDAQSISAMRTGAVSSLAAKHLVDPQTDTVSLIGAGVNMRTQLLGILHACPQVTTVKVWSRTSHVAFAEEMSQSLGLQVQPVTTIEEAVVGSRFIVTCLGSVPDPLVLEHHVSSGGVTLFNIGGTEMEPKILATMDRVVADLWDHAKHRKNQTHAVAVQRGYIPSTKVENLGPILRGEQPGRQSSEERIFFCPTGLCFEDTLIGWRIYETARKRNLGNRIRLWDNPKWI